jgi:hypothetical protein
MRLGAFSKGASFSKILAEKILVAIDLDYSAKVVFD